MSKLKQHALEFKAKVALEALKGEGWGGTVAPVARRKPEQRGRAGELVRGASVTGRCLHANTERRR
ncbi:hypothetical protein NBRC116599_26160 [Aquicoccus sp. SU-CL01552]